MKLIFIFAIVLIEMLFIHLFKIMEVVRTFRVYTLMYDEVFAVLLVNEIMGAMGAL